jgi:RND family efflux transporter MFP subunit
MPYSSKSGIAPSASNNRWMPFSYRQSLKSLAMVLCLQPLVFVSCVPVQESKNGPKNAVSPEETVVSGQIYSVQPVRWPKQVRCQGSLVADELTIVSAKVAGQVSDVNVDLGDQVEKQSVLVQLDRRDFLLQADQMDAQLLQARSAVGLRPGDPLEKLDPDNAPPVREARAVWDETKKAVARIRELSNRDAISATDLEVAEAAERVASARYSSAQNGVREKIALISVQSAQRDLAYQRAADTTILAPFAGLVESRLVAPGTYVQPGTALLTVAKTDVLRFRASVPERYSQQLKIGQKILLAFDLSDQEREVTISRISPALDQANRSLTFEADIPNVESTLRCGLFGEGVLILDPDSMGIAIPASAIVRFAGVEKVWKIVGGKLKEQLVVLGRQQDDMIEIKSGLKAGDQVLVDGKLGKAGLFKLTDS